MYNYSQSCTYPEHMYYVVPAYPADIRIREYPLGQILHKSPAQLRNRASTGFSDVDSLSWQHLPGKHNAGRSRSSGVGDMPVRSA